MRLNSYIGQSVPKQPSLTVVETLHAKVDALIAVDPAEKVGTKLTNMFELIRTCSPYISWLGARQVQSSTYAGAVDRYRLALAWERIATWPSEVPVHQRAAYIRVREKVSRLLVEEMQERANTAWAVWPLAALRGRNDPYARREHARFLSGEYGALCEGGMRGKGRGLFESWSLYEVTTGDFVARWPHCNPDEFAWVRVRNHLIVPSNMFDDCADPEFLPDVFFKKAAQPARMQSGIVEKMS